jgi:hypothetical protein
MAWTYAAGTSGTVTLPAGSILLSIRCESHSATGTVAIFGGTAIPVDGATGGAAHIIGQWYFGHGNAAASGTYTVVFVNTASYFVEYLTP